MIFLFSPVAGLAACMCWHVFATRMWPDMFRLWVAIHSALMGQFCLGAFAVAFSMQTEPVATEDFWGNAALWELAYLSLVYCYFLGFFNVGESARRVRLLIELESAGTRGLTLQEILSAYNADMIVTARLARLVASGQILERDGQYYMGKPLMLAVAKTSVLLKRVFLGSRSEFGEARPSGISSPPARGSL